MSINLGTLTKISYTNLNEFVDSINRNFAVVQNSPLFKGIPGNEGEDGGPGPKGERGSKIFFVDFVKFNLQFPTEVTLGSHIDLVYLNSKLSTPDGKTKVLTAIDSPNLVDKDIFILTNSLMLSYNYAENKFYDTGKSLNTSITTEIQEIINNLFQSYLPQLQAGIQNVFESYSTLAKNYSDNNNTGINTTINQTSVYSPFIQGVTSNVGIPVDNHKYLGISQTLNNENTDSTVIFGSIVKYYKLLMNTLNTDGSQTLTSNYAPGVNNIPSAIFMQDTYNNGLLFGFKGKQNLKNFGSIFKNDSDELEIKSDSGKLNSDFSSLKIHKNYLRYNKLVQFNDSLELSQNIFIGGHVNNRVIKTGNYSFNENNDIFEENGDTTFNKNNIISVFGKDNKLNLPDIILKGNNSEKPIGINSNKYYINHSNNIYLRATNYRGRVLVTDGNGLIGSNYVVENTKFSDYGSTTWVAPKELTSGNPSDKFITTYYYNYLVQKINNMFTTQINGLYWTKDEFETGIIPNLVLGNNLTVNKITKLGKLATFNQDTSTITLTSPSIIITSPSIRYSGFRNRIMVNDTLGYAQSNVSVDYEKFNDFSGSNGGVILKGSEIGTGTGATNFPTLTITDGLFEVITKYHYNKIINYLNTLNTNLGSKYWTKPEFETFIIPKLNVSTGLFSRKFLAIGKGLNNAQTDGSFRDNSDGISFYVDGDNDFIYIGGSQLQISSPTIRISGYSNNQILGIGAKPGTSNGTLRPINTISTLQSITTETYNSLNNQANITLADNKTIASLILGITTNYNNLLNYINTQINILTNQFNQQLNDLATDIYTKINVINNQITNINNELATKATIQYVDNHVNNIYTNINNINQTLQNQQNQIDVIKQQLNTKVDKSVFEPWKAIVDEFMTNNIQFPKGGIILWEGKTINGLLQAAIPEGWEEVKSMRGRVPVGWTNGEYDVSFYGRFSKLDEIGGTAMHVMNELEMPSHRHKLVVLAKSNNLMWNYPEASIATFRDASNTDKDYDLGSIGGTPNAGWSAPSGSGQAHENTQPYKVVIYLRAKRGA